MFANGKGLKLYKAYQERLKILNAADFGDLLLENIRLFREQPEVLRQYQSALQVHPGRRISGHQRRAISVAAAAGADERKRALPPRARGEGDARSERVRGRFRSLEPRRSRPLTSTLSPPAERARPRTASGAKNICCVGDDDQSIYGWRGAEVDNILRFEHDFPGATVIRLERNYRSTGHILAAASHLIAHNEGRLGKTLRTDDVPGEKVTVTGAWDSEEEARAIGEEIEQLQRERPSRSTRSPSWCAPRSRCANSKTASSRSACPTASSAARASTSAPKSATRSPICAWSIRRPTISPSSASSMCRSAGSATPPCSCCTTTPASAACR